MGIKEFFKKQKRKSISDDLLELAAMDEEELWRDNCSPERKKEIRMQMGQKYEALGKIEAAKIDRSGKIIAGLIAALGSLFGIGLTIVNYETQYRRSRNPEDEAQSDLMRNKFGASNNIKRP